MSEAEGLRADALQDDDRDLTLRLLCVLVVVRPDLVRLAPQPLALLAVGRARVGPEDLVLHLQLDLRGLLEVLVPAWMVGGAALGGDDHVARAVLRVDERRRVLVAGLAARRRQEKDGRALAPVVAHLAPGLA